MNFKIAKGSFNFFVAYFSSIHMEHFLLIQVKHMGKKQKTKAEFF